LIWPVKIGTTPTNQHRDDDQQADIFLHTGRAENAAMLDREDDQHQHRADEEG